MAVSIANRNFRPDYALTDKNWLVGNVFDRVNFSYDIDIEYSYESTLQDGCQYDHLLNTIALDQGTWFEKGFKVGDNVAFVLWATSDGAYNTPVILFNRTVTALNGNTMTLNNVLQVASNSAVVPSFRPGVPVFQDPAYLEYIKIKVFSLADPQGIRHQMNLLDNDKLASFSMASIHDGSELWFTLDNIMSASSNDMVQNGEMTGFTFQECKLTHVNTYSSAFEYRNRFTIFGSFYIWGLWDSETSAENLTPPEWFENTLCLNDILNVKFYRDYNDPNNYQELKPALPDGTNTHFGNNGWIEENWNGLPPGSLVELDYIVDVETGNFLTAIPYNRTSQIHISMNDTLTADTKFKACIVRIPNDTSLLQSPQIEYMNQFITTFSNLEGWSANDGTGILPPVTNETFPREGVEMNLELIEFNNGSSIVLKFDPDFAFAEYIESFPEADRKYMLFISIAKDDGNLADWQTKKRTNELIQFDDFIYYQTPRVVTGGFDIYQHTNEPDTAPNDCFHPSFIGEGPTANPLYIYKEDEIKCVLDLDIDGNSELTFLRLAVGIFTLSQTEFATPYSTVLNLNSMIQGANNRWFIDIEQELPLYVNGDNTKNRIKVKDIAFDLGTETTTIRIEYSVRGRFNMSVDEITPPILFNPSIENNNQGADWSKYGTGADGYLITPYIDYDITNNITNNILKDRKGSAVFWQDYESGVPVLQSSSVISEYGSTEIVPGEFMVVNGSHVACVVFQSVDFNNTGAFPYDINNRYWIHVALSDSQTGTIYSQITASNYYESNNDNPITGVTVSAIDTDKIQVCMNINGDFLNGQGVPKYQLSVRFNCTCEALTE